MSENSGWAGIIGRFLFIYIDNQVLKTRSRTRFRQAERESWVGPKWMNSYAGIDASDPIPQGVHTGQLGVGIGHIFQCCLASLELIKFRLALGPAELDHELFGVLAFLQH